VPLKTRRKKVHAIEIPILPDLAAIIEASRAGDMTFLMTEWGKPFTANGFGGWFRARCDEAGLPQCGLRKAGATIAAERGATDRQLMAMYGWESAAKQQPTPRQLTERNSPPKPPASSETIRTRTSIAPPNCPTRKKHDKRKAYRSTGGR
jgi:hypothetical protein